MSLKVTLLNDLLDGLDLLLGARIPPEDLADAFAQWLHSVGAALEGAGMVEELGTWNQGITGLRFSDEDERLYVAMRSARAVLLGMRTRIQSQDLPQSALDTFADLRSCLANIGNADAARFLEEAISCLESRLYRATVVLSWVGAVSLLYDCVVSNHLAHFNAEATRRDGKWRQAVTPDDLARMKESDFLEILEALSIIGRNVKQQLQECLQLRNACGHPSSLAISTNKTAAHLETLVLNVFLRFS